MINIKEMWDTFKSNIAEKRAAMWLSFKSKLSPKMQENIDKFERWYKSYSESTLGDTINTIVFVLVMVIIIRFFLFEIRWIPSGSMTPTLVVKDRIVVERYSRFFSTPKRGDIMVFYPPSTVLSRNPIKLLERLTGILCKDTAYIKRVVGMPGDKVEIKYDPDGAAYVYINDKKYDEPYIKSAYEYPSCPDSRMGAIILLDSQTMKCGPFHLGDKEYFMMGDNRGNSQDSRYWGVLKEDRFIGRAVFLWWPLNRIRVLHRLDNNI